MTVNRYKSDAVYKDVVLKAAAFSFGAGLVVNIPIAIWIIFTSLTECYGREDYLTALTALPLAHIMVFTFTFLLLCSAFALMSKPSVPKD